VSAAPATSSASRPDGRTSGYIPADTLTIDPSLRLWAEQAGDLDPVTYEVLRHNLWHVNAEHGDTIVRVSGSPIVVFGQDFNTCLLNAQGDYVFFGPYYQVHSGIQDVSAKWILENRSANPGIHDGDMFLHNDPWVGTLHQPDTMVLCPVFWQGRLFCWVGAVLHFADVGGPTPGGWCPDAESVFDEPLPTPPVKIVKNGVLQDDVADMWIRRSRVPDSIALDLRALIAGCTVAREGVLKLLRRYGAPAVASVMSRIVDDAEQRFLDKLARIPDGIWQERSYLEVARPGDRSAYPCHLTLKKEGTTLSFSNKGTHPATGALNVTYAAWRGAILAAIGPLLCHDSLFAVGGALRHCRFEPASNTILSADYPASVSNGGAIGCLLTIALANNVLAGMMSCDPGLNHELSAPTGLSQWPVTALYGQDQHGKDFSTIVLDWYLGSLGAQSFRDGVHTGGVYWGPYHLAPNIEQIEQSSPVLYLHRGELQDGAGVGTYRSGAGPTAAWTPHKTDQILLNISCCGIATPTGLGVNGGYPGIPNALTVTSASDLWERIGRGDLPEPGDLAGARRVLQPKERDLILRHGDVYEGWASGGAGFGDPLDRDPAAVAADIAEGYVTRASAERFYFVAVTADTAVDETRTRQLRDAERRFRAGHPVDLDALEQIPDERVLVRLGPWLCVINAPGGHHRFACRRCAQDLGPATSNPKERATRIDRDLAEAGARFTDPSQFIDDTMQFRQFVCPRCATAFDHEVARDQDAPLHRAAILGTPGAATPDGAG
jgi:N-methylhydantoinase B